MVLPKTKRNMKHEIKQANKKKQYPENTRLEKRFD